jgi:hypothetical protein
MLRASLRIAAIDRSDWFDELATMKTPPRHIFAFLVTRLYGRPDLNPDEMPLSAVPQDIATLDCPLWADATVQKRGITVLGTLPHVSHCADIPLGQPRALPAN